jgi:hypothetical protein
VSPADRAKEGGSESMGDEPRTPTPYEKFVAATKRVLSVSKEKLEKREKAWRKRRAKKHKS